LALVPILVQLVLYKLHLQMKACFFLNFLFFILDKQAGDSHSVRGTTGEKGKTVQ